MDFLETFEHYSNALGNRHVVTLLWKEITHGERAGDSLDTIIDYSFHHPIDLTSFLEELHEKFEESMKEDLRAISGSLKAYMLTFLYYCMGTDHITVPHRCRLLAAELYARMITIPSGIGIVFYERNLLLMALMNINSIAKNVSCPTDHVIVILKLLHKFLLGYDDATVYNIKAFANTYANIIKVRGIKGDIKQCNDPITKFCLNGIKDLVSVKELPKQLSGIMESLLRCLCRDKNDDRIAQGRRILAVNTTKQFVEYYLLVEVDPNKSQYFLDSLFSIFGNEDFDLVEECVEIINLLNQQLYKELLRRIPNYLESINHEKYYDNLMELIYHMFKNPHPKKFPKLDVLFLLCFKSILIKFLNKKKLLAYRSMEMVGKICLLNNSYMLDSIFKLVNETEQFVNLDLNSVFKAMIKLLKDPYTATPTRVKHLLNFASTILRKTDHVDQGLSSQLIHLICKDGCPYSIKELLKPLHELYVHLSNKCKLEVSTAIMRVFVKMAMHMDATASVFLHHLYKYCVSPSIVNGETHGPHVYSNLLFSDEFDYKLLLGKCVNFIHVEDVHQIIANFNHRHSGYPVLLDCLLEFVEYREFRVLTDYIIDNYDDLGFHTSTLHLLHAYNRILGNMDEYFLEDVDKFLILREKIWISLIKQTCGLRNIRICFVLIDTLKDLVEEEDEEHRKNNVLSIASAMAFKAFSEQAYYDGSVLYLTEFAIALKKEPPPNFMALFERMVYERSSLNLLKEHLDMLIQLISLLGTIALMNRPRVPVAVKLCQEAFKVYDPFVRIIAVKTYYTIATEITHEFPEIIAFCFSQVSSSDTSLAKVCLTILEELINNNYISLNDYDFMRFTHRLASINLGPFMKHLLTQRFLVSNKHDIGRFFMHTLIYISGYDKLDNYPIDVSYRYNLATMRSLMDGPNELIQFLFGSLQVKAKFNVLREMSFIFDSMVTGICRVNDEFFIYFRFALYTFKVMAEKPTYNYNSGLYGQVCRFIDKSILNNEPISRNLTFYGEFESDLKKCTSTLLALLNHVYNDSRLDEYLLETFDTVACWITHFKNELVQYVQYEKFKEFNHPMGRMILMFKALKPRLVHFIDSRERSDFFVA
ncbi:unnamed protein product [Ceutorhynchus assimilis]|uniref:Uncharacterized protein n=1 Tax=Ceutorhynchus assimilis TaxID=467358 RepID=A0A9N9M883_9CUCU|nr:unnamed protein product [Ceutorhynchus assimilis]